MSHEPSGARSDADHPGPPSDPESQAAHARDKQQTTPGEAGRASGRQSTERGAAAPQLARLHRQAGLSQAELAALAGVGVATISRLERGARAHYSTLLLLARALGTTRSHLISKSRRRAKPSSLRAGSEP